MKGVLIHPEYPKSSHAKGAGRRAKSGAGPLGLGTPRRSETPLKVSATSLRKVPSSNPAPAFDNIHPPARVVLGHHYLRDVNQRPCEESRSANAADCLAS